METLVNLLTQSAAPLGLHDDLQKLADSFRLLRETANQVSSKATTTAHYVKDILHETTIRFFSVIDSINDDNIIKVGVGLWKALSRVA